MYVYLTFAINTLQAVECLAIPDHSTISYLND